MKPALADRLSRAVIGCYPPRWKQRYAAEMLDVLDQHRAGPRTVLSLAGGAVGTHLDPDYRMQIRLSRDAKIYIAIFAATIVGVPALVILPMIPRAIRESRWQPSSSDSVAAIAFSRDQRIMVSANDGPPWEATSTLWDLTGQARPRRLSIFEGGSPATISPDGATVATNPGGGQLALWDVTRPRHPARLARLPAGPGALWGQAFSPDGRILAAASASGLVLWNVADPARPRLLRRLATAPLVPRGNLLAGVTYHGSVLVFRVAGPAGPVLVTSRPGILASARFPGGGRSPAIPCGCGADAAYAAAFTADGHALTVVIARPETSPGTAARDTVFTWQVTGPGALSGLTTIFRDVSDAQPTLAAGGRVVADGSVVGGQVHLWTLP